jgi:hypothetical protein
MHGRRAADQGVELGAGAAIASVIPPTRSVDPDATDPATDPATDQATDHATTARLAPAT